MSGNTVIGSVPSMSSEAQAIKLADVIANVHDVRTDPDSSWSPERKEAYVRYAPGVLNAIAAPNARLAVALRGKIRAFDQSVSQLEGGAR